MNLIDVTNSYAREIRQELRSSSVHYIKVYTLGNSVVVHKKKNEQHEIVISNKIRSVTKNEVDFVLDKLLGEKREQASVTNAGNLVEIEAQIN
ncbi:DUF1827 family protein [Ligilactobacillus salitolerans]|uniref:DUF1827 family protein n=1 Tax=Ligilactobacillus salitolerans TaxID=1808352 RepID=UPI000F60D4B5